MDHAMPAIGKPFEANEMVRERCRDIGLTFDGMHRIILSSKYQGWALNAMKGMEHVE